MPSIGKGVEEIRVRYASRAFRVVYTARRKDAVFVLNAFEKKSQATPWRELDIARVRFAQLMREAP